MCHANMTTHRPRSIASGRAVRVLVKQTPSGVPRQAVRCGVLSYQPVEVFKMPRDASES